MSIRKVEITQESMLAVMLNTIDAVKTFVTVTMRYDEDTFITDGKYIIDAKSIMGIFSLDLSKPLYVYTEPNNIKDNTRLVNDLANFTFNS